MKAVIQAGGMGTRLRPYTLILPKPLMPIGGVPVIEMLLKWLRRNGVDQTYVTTGYLGHLIRALCGDGRQWDIKIQYSEEPEPLGTVGALSLLKDQLNETFLVLNGDLLSDLDIHAFYNAHTTHNALLTVGVTSKKVHVDLGVLETQKGRVIEFREKPTLNYKVSMGIYCMEPEILELIPKGIAFGFDDLMHIMLERDLPVNTYHHDGQWIDIGRPADFKKAQEQFDANSSGLMVG